MDAAPLPFLAVASPGGVDIVVGVICLILAIRGAFKGFVWQTVRTLGAIGALWAATLLHEPVGTWLVERLDFIPASWSDFVGWVSVAIGVWLVVSFIAHLARGVIRSADLTGGDRVLGFVLGAVLGIALSTFLFAIYGKATNEEQLRETLRHSVAAEGMARFVRLVRPIAPDFVETWSDVLDTIESSPEG